MTNGNVIPLPPNATRLELTYSESGAAILDQDIPIDRLWDAWRCPDAFLPFLAYALSVDLWDDAWDEVTKRQVIADSPNYHRLKGTRLAVEQAATLAGGGLAYDLTEWWETTPQGRRGTGRLLYALTDPATGKAVRARAKRLVYAAKPKSRAIAIQAGMLARGPAPLAIGVLRSRTIIIEPYRVLDQVINSAAPVAIGMLRSRTITIEVKAA